jgi:hypothetical protein
VLQFAVHNFEDGSPNLFALLQFIAAAQVLVVGSPKGLFVVSHEVSATHKCEVGSPYLFAVLQFTAEVHFFVVGSPKGFDELQFCSVTQIWVVGSP